MGLWERCVGFEFMKTLHCLYQHLDIKPVPLSQVSLASYHMDERWKHRDLPSITNDGMWYPVLYDRVTPEWWDNTFTGCFSYREDWKFINPPTIHSDGFIYLIRIGNNRIQVAEHLEYDAIDGIYFPILKDLIEFNQRIKTEDPYNVR